MFNLLKINNMKAYLYHIKAITNLQVCSGEENFGVIDNLIQRDAATGFPAINASSLKGALREFFEQTQPEGVDVNTLFGSKPNEKNNPNAGALRFLDAHLLAMPVRANRTPYLMATSPSIIKEYLTFIELFGLGQYNNEKNILNSIEDLYKSRKNNNENIPNYVINSSFNGMLVEDLNSLTEPLTQVQLKDSEDKLIDLTDLLNLLKDLIGDNVLLVSNEIFQLLCNNDHLPIIARNCLESGHENLWYEQVLPRFSKLYFFVLSTNDILKIQEKNNEDKIDSIDEKMEKYFASVVKKSLVQIGANASVGYGFSKIEQRLPKNN